MILFLRSFLIFLAVLFTYFFGETMEQFLLQVIRSFIAVDPSNAIRFNLIHLGILVFPLFMFGLCLSIAAIDDARLRQRFLRIAASMFLAIVLYRIYQVWRVLKVGAFTSEEDLRSQTQAFTSGQLIFLEQIFPYAILGAASALIPAIQEPKEDSIFFATLSSLCIFIWLIITHKLPLTQGFSQSVSSFSITVFSGWGLGTLVKRIRES